MGLGGTIRSFGRREETVALTTGFVRMSYGTWEGNPSVLYGDAGEVTSRVINIAPCASKYEFYDHYYLTYIFLNRRIGLSSYDGKPCGTIAGYPIHDKHACVYLSAENMLCAYDVSADRTHTLHELDRDPESRVSLYRRVSLGESRSVLLRDWDAPLDPEEDAMYTLLRWGEDAAPDSAPTRTRWCGSRSECEMFTDGNQYYHTIELLHDETQETFIVNTYEIPLADECASHIIRRSEPVATRRLVPPHVPVGNQERRLYHSEHTLRGGTVAVVVIWYIRSSQARIVLFSLCDARGLLYDSGVVTADFSPVVTDRQQGVFCVQNKRYTLHYVRYRDPASFSEVVRAHAAYRHCKFDV